MWKNKKPLQFLVSEMFFFLNSIWVENYLSTQFSQIELVLWQKDPKRLIKNEGSMFAITIFYLLLRYQTQNIFLFWPFLWDNEKKKKKNVKFSICLDQTISFYQKIVFIDFKQQLDFFSAAPW